MAHYSLTGAKAGKTYFLLGLALLVYSGWRNWDDYRFKQKAIQGCGTIVAIQKTRGTGKITTNLWIDIRYKTLQTETKVARYYEDAYSRHIGDAITFLYDPDHPQVARPIETAAHDTWVWWFLTGFSFLWIWMATVILRKPA